MACWVFKGKGNNLNDPTIYTFTGCFDKPSWGLSGYNDGSQAPYDNGRPVFSGWASVNNSLTRVINQEQLNSLVRGTAMYGSSCANCFASLYDCVNGICVESPNGIHTTLEACEAACGGGTGCAAPNICVPPNYCPPDMVCLPIAEFLRIEALGVALGNSACT
jgi:hypothetical protein